MGLKGHSEDFRYSLSVTGREHLRDCLKAVMVSFICLKGREGGAQLEVDIKRF